MWPLARAVRNSWVAASRTSSPTGSSTRGRARIAQCRAKRPLVAKSLDHGQAGDDLVTEVIEVVTEPEERTTFFPATVVVRGVRGVGVTFDERCDPSSVYRIQPRNIMLAFALLCAVVAVTGVGDVLTLRTSHLPGHDEVVQATLPPPGVSGALVFNEAGELVSADTQSSDVTSIAVRVGLLEGYHVNSAYAIELLLVPAAGTGSVSAEPAVLDRAKTTTLLVVDDAGRMVARSAHPTRPEIVPVDEQRFMHDGIGRLVQAEEDASGDERSMHTGSRVYKTYDGLSRFEHEAQQLFVLRASALHTTAGIDGLPDKWERAVSTEHRDGGGAGSGTEPGAGSGAEAEEPQSFQTYESSRLAREFEVRSARTKTGLVGSWWIDVSKKLELNGNLVQLLDGRPAQVEYGGAIRVGKKLGTPARLATTWFRYNARKQVNYVGALRSSGPVFEEYGLAYDSATTMRLERGHQGLTGAGTTSVGTAYSYNYQDPYKQAVTGVYRPTLVEENERFSLDGELKQKSISPAALGTPRPCRRARSRPGARSRRGSANARRPRAARRRPRCARRRAQVEGAGSAGTGPPGRSGGLGRGSGDRSVGACSWKSSGEWCLPPRDGTRDRGYRCLFIARHHTVSRRLRAIASIHRRARGQDIRRERR